MDGMMIVLRGTRGACPQVSPPLQQAVFAIYQILLQQFLREPRDPQESSPPFRAGPIEEGGTELLFECWIVDVVLLQRRVGLGGDIERYEVVASLHGNLSIGSVHFTAN